MLVGRDRPTSSLPNVTSWAKPNTTKCGKSDPLATGNLVVLELPVTLFREVGKAYRSRINERSSMDTPSHGSVPLTVVTDAPCPLPDAVVVRTGACMLLQIIVVALNCFWLKERDNFVSTHLPICLGGTIPWFCAWNGPPNPSRTSPVGLPFLNLDGLARINRDSTKIFPALLPSPNFTLHT